MKKRTLITVRPHLRQSELIADATRAGEALVSDTESKLDALRGECKQAAPSDHKSISEAKSRFSVAARGGRCNVMEYCAELLTSWEVTIYVQAKKQASPIWLLSCESRLVDY